MRDPRMVLKIAILARELTWFMYVSVSRLANTRGNCELLKFRTKGETKKISNRLAKTQTLPFAMAELEGLRIVLTISRIAIIALKAKIENPKILESKFR